MAITFTASTPSCQVIKALSMISERERITMNYLHGSLISFVTPLLFDACTDLSRPKRLVIIVCSFSHVLPQFIHVVLCFFLCVCICISMFLYFLFIGIIPHLLFEVSCMYVCYLLFPINNNKILTLKARKSLNFHTTPFFEAPVLGGTT